MLFYIWGLIYRYMVKVICVWQSRVWLRIGSCLACVYRVMDVRGKFGEHERSVRVARGVAESNSSFFSSSFSSFSSKGWLKRYFRTSKLGYKNCEILCGITGSREKLFGGIPR